MSLFYSCSASASALHPFPTRRSSDLRIGVVTGVRRVSAHRAGCAGATAPGPAVTLPAHSHSPVPHPGGRPSLLGRPPGWRSEEHTSELQSLRHLVCRLLLEKKKIIQA